MYKCILHAPVESELTNAFAGLRTHDVHQTYAEEMLTILYTRICVCMCSCVDFGLSVSIVECLTAEIV